MLSYRVPRKDRLTTRVIPSIRDIDRGGQGEIDSFLIPEPGPRGLDGKNFWEENFAKFLEWNFGLEFAENRGVLGNPANYQWNFCGI